ncbi:MAG: PAS domain S-box protein, partial [Methylococcaceae bacterium]|nr:PAS domain S-box protein [Methylococcaceae bacterium]
KLRDHLRQTNFHSLASIPFRLQRRTIGVLNLLSRDVGSFEAEEEINLFDEMGLDISFALDKLEVEKVKRQWADAFEHCAHGIAIALPTGRLLTCNPAFARQQGGTVEEISSMSILEMYERSEHEYIKQRIAEADHVGHVQFEANKVRKDGSTYPVQMDLVSVRDEDGNLLYRVATQEDITERKRAEEAIAALAKFPSENPNPVLRVDGNGIILYANPASVPILNAWGRETGQALSNDWRERIASSLRSAQINEVEMDCNGRLFSCILAPVIDDGYVNIYGRDVTEHRQAEAERRNFYDTLNASLNELYIFDAETLHFEFVSNGALRNLGYSLDEMRGMTPLDLKPGFTLTSFNDLIAPLRLQEEQVINFETFHRRADDSLYPVEVHLQLLERGEGQAFLAVILDITERKLAEKQIQVQLNRMRALNEIDRAISSSLDMRLSLDTLLDKVLSQLEVDAASVLVLNPYSQTLEYEAGKGFHSPSIRESQMRLGQGLAGQIGVERKVIHIPDLAALGDIFLRQELLKKEEFVEYFGVPLIAKGILKGVLEVFHRTHLNPDLEWINYLETLGGQAAIAIDNAQLFEGMQRSNLELVTAYDATIEGWSRAMDLRDKETEGHTLRVTELTVRLAKRMGVNQQEVAHMRRGALLHDIGKLGIPDHILLKPDKLSEVEWAIMRQHPKHAFNMLMPINYLRPALDIPYCHHEKWNGTGYPRGLKGEDIPLVARIFAVVDVWDALRSDRPYRASWPAEKVREYIIEESGKHFDPQVVRVFLELLDEDPSLQ